MASLAGRARRYFKRDTGLSYASAISNHLIVDSEAFMDLSQRELAFVSVAVTGIEMTDTPVVGYLWVVNEFQHDAACVGACGASVEQGHNLLVEQLFADLGWGFHGIIMA